MRDHSQGPGLREHAIVFSRFLRSPRTVGAISASSRALAQSMAAGLDLAAPVNVIELGPGTGALTWAIVDKLGPETRFLAIDIDPEFVREIQKRWPKIACICASAEQVDAHAAERGMTPVDHIISGLPFISLPLPMTKKILAGIRNALRSGGTFTTFQYLHGYALPSAVRFRRSMTELLGAPPAVTVEMKNVPPALVLRWTKTQGTGVIRP